MTPAEKWNRMIQRKFGQRLKAARVKRFRDLVHFARHVSMSESDYRDLEAGLWACDWALMTRLCDALGITPNYLLPEAANEPAKRPTMVAGSNVIPFRRRA
jgi:Helix-turn-helix domain